MAEAEASYVAGFPVPLPLPVLRLRLLVVTSQGPRPLVSYRPLAPPGFCALNRHLFSPLADGSCAEEYSTHNIIGSASSANETTREHSHKSLAL